jgi:hypothetical protein
MNTTYKVTTTRADVNGELGRFRDNTDEERFPSVTPAKNPLEGGNIRLSSSDAHESTGHRARSPGHTACNLGTEARPPDAQVEQCVTDGPSRSIMESETKASTAWAVLLQQAGDPAAIFTPRQFSSGCDPHTAGVPPPRFLALPAIESPRFARIVSRESEEPPEEALQDAVVNDTLRVLRGTPQPRSAGATEPPPLNAPREICPRVGCVNCARPDVRPAKAGAFSGK